MIKKKVLEFIDFSEFKDEVLRRAAAQIDSNEYIHDVTYEFLDTLFYDYIANSAYELISLKEIETVLEDDNENVFSELEKEIFSTIIFPLAKEIGFDDDIVFYYEW